jgi:release factor glutamine methyltransferase
MNKNWPAMKTVSDVLKMGAAFLAQKGIASPRLQVEELLSHVLKVPRIELYMQFDRPLVEGELEQLRGYMKLRAQKMPWQYIVGQVAFLGCLIEVSRDVLIPRHETEILGEMVIKELPPTPVVVWDLCCGSGCLGIAIKKKRPDCGVVLSDLSPAAVETAQKNAQKNGADVAVRQGDLCGPFRGEKADVVVCNPPYVSEEHYARLEPEVRDWEPRGALVGGGQGTELYERLAKELPPYLNHGAKVYLEIGTEMGCKLKNLFNEDCWGKVEVRTDWSSHERFMCLEFQDLLI